MAGRARRQALSDELDKRVIDRFDLDPVDVSLGNVAVPSQLDYVCAWMEAGKTAKDLCASLTKSLGLDLAIPYDFLMRYLRERFGEERVEAAMDTARMRASHSMAEDALRIVDARADTKEAVARAASRARSRQWMAERYNPSKYGQSKGVNVAISVTQLHLGALQHPSNTVTGSLAQPAHNTSLSGAEQAQVVAVTPVSPSQG